MFTGFYGTSQTKADISDLYTDSNKQSFCALKTV